MKKLTIEIKWALLFMVMTLAWLFLERIAGLHSVHIDKHPVYTNFIAIPAIAFYVFALNEKRKKFYGGTMTYLQGLKAGIWITVFVTILSPLTQVIASYVVTPDFFQNAISYAVKMEKSTRTEAENYFNVTNYIIQALIGAPVMGLITTAIVAIFTRGKSNNN